MSGPPPSASLRASRAELWTCHKRMVNMLIAKLTEGQKVDHILRWAAEWDGSRTGRSMWSYSLSLGGSHAVLNDWMKNEKLMGLLTPGERNLVRAARERAAQVRRARRK